MNTAEYKIKSVMLGHAVGDALGVPVEFTPREMLNENPVTDMIGYGTYDVPAGCWSDDTSMALAALDSLAAGKVDWTLIMDNFCRWLYLDDYTPTGSLFDVGSTCREAIQNYAEHGIAAPECGLSDESANGNGSLMRIHPFSLHQYFQNNRNMEKIHQASSLTHGHIRSKIACGIYSFVLWELLDSPAKASVCLGLEHAYNYYKNTDENRTFLNLYQNIGCIRQLSTCSDRCAVSRDDIQSDGYVVSTLEAAIWCLLTTDSYRECILRAVNLGYDTDTTAAVAGGLAGALYGADSIPSHWIEQLRRKEYIEDICANASTAICIQKSQDPTQDAPVPCSV